MSLAIENVSKSFAEKNVLKDVSFEVKAGEFVSLIGPSGSGKSTLFGMIGGMLTPNSGDIIMSGESIVNKRGHMSYMPQQDSLFPWRTVLENVLLGQEISSEVTKDKAIQMLQIAGLKDVINAYPAELSGGMRQRVSFIRALLCPQNLLCLDEPFSALDEFTRIDMQQWLLETWEKYEQSILFITHNIEEALFLSDKIVILSHSPAVVKEVIEIPFARPRDPALMLTGEFLKWKRKVMNLIQSKN